MLNIREATADDAVELAPAMRHWDKFEAGYTDNDLALTGVLVDSINRSSQCFAAVDSGGDVVAVFGVVDGEVMGIPWMLATDSLYQHKRDLVKISKVYADKWGEQFPLLSNYVYEENTKAISYLKHLGFKFIKRKEDGFIQFVKIQELEDMNV